MNQISKVTDEAVGKAKAAKPGAKLVVVECELDSGDIFEGIFESPSNDSIAKYVSANSRAANVGDKDTLRRQCAFVMENIVFPTREEYFEIQKNLPLLSVSLANELMTGVGLARESKKKII